MQTPYFHDWRGVYHFEHLPGICALPGICFLATSLICSIPPWCDTEYALEHIQNSNSEILALYKKRDVAFMTYFSSVMILWTLDTCSDNVHITKRAIIVVINHIGL